MEREKSNTGAYVGCWDACVEKSSDFEQVIPLYDMSLASMNVQKLNYSMPHSEIRKLIDILECLIIAVGILSVINH